MGRYRPMAGTFPKCSVVSTGRIAGKPAPTEKSPVSGPAQYLWEPAFGCRPQAEFGQWWPAAFDPLRTIKSAQHTYVPNETASTEAFFRVSGFTLNFVSSPMPH